jgi:hypothetical protein
MMKILAILIVLLMVTHLIRPFGLPGLKRRKDVWKIGVAFAFAMGLMVLLRP